MYLTLSSYILLSSIWTFKNVVIAYNMTINSCNFIHLIVYFLAETVSWLKTLKMNRIPGLSLSIPAADTPVEGLEPITLTGFDCKTFNIPGQHRVMILLNFFFYCFFTLSNICWKAWLLKKWAHYNILVHGWDGLRNVFYWKSALYS